MIKIIAMDMDGTLLNSQKKISPKTKEALMKAQEAGIKFFHMFQNRFSFFHSHSLIEQNFFRHTIHYLRTIVGN